MNWKNMLSVLMMALSVLACSKDDRPPTPDPMQQPDPEPENRAPTADAGDDQKVIIGSVVKVSASSSSDLDGDELTYNWSFLNKPEGSAASIIGGGQSTAEFTLDKAGVYELQLKVDDGSLESLDVIKITNRVPIINEVEIGFKDIKNVVFREEYVDLEGDFFSPDINENQVFIGDIPIEIDGVSINHNGGDMDGISFQIPENAKSGILKVVVGEEEVVWDEIVKMLSTPVDDFVDANPDLEERRRSDQNGYDPTSYFEIGTRFIPRVDGEVVGLRIRSRGNQTLTITLWSSEQKIPIAQKTSQYHTGGGSYTDLLPTPIALEKGKEYVITINSNDWFLHIDEQDAQKNHFPQTTNDFEILSTVFRAGTDTIYPEEGFPKNYIIRGPDILFAADPE